MSKQKHEVSASLLTTIKDEFISVKWWFNNHKKSLKLRKEYAGTFPSFWWDVLEWDGWKDVRMAYLSSILIFSPIITRKSSLDVRIIEKKKRKSRWATSSTLFSSQSTDQLPLDKSTNSLLDRPKRRSRWSRESSGNSCLPVLSSPKILENKSISHISFSSVTDTATSILPVKSSTVLDILSGLPSNFDSAKQSELSELQRKLREANEKLDNLEMEAARIDSLSIGHKDRSPSPPPVYGADGKRKNTRAVRWREKYNSQRQEALEKILSIANPGGNYDPNAVAPSLFKRKRFKKIPIPVDEHPTYNFIGLIIGPRGRTQKEMENKTGCKIAIRGRGSIKEGARGRRDGRGIEGEDEPLHVVVTGDDQTAVDAAGNMVEQMLVVIDDDKNIHKQRQLRELALLNGTLKDEEYCQICAEKGHRSYECPKRFSLTKEGITIKCLICGDTSHPTRDCSQNNNIPEHLHESQKEQLDSDYNNFMAELDGFKKNLGVSSTPCSMMTNCLSVPELVNFDGSKKTTAVDISSSYITTISKRIIRGNEVIESRSHENNMTTPLVTHTIDPLSALTPLPPVVPVIPSSKEVNIDMQGRTSSPIKVDSQLSTSSCEIGLHQHASMSKSSIPVCVQSKPLQSSSFLHPFSPPLPLYRFDFIPPPPPLPSRKYLSNSVQSQSPKTVKLCSQNEQLGFCTNKYKNEDIFQFDKGTPEWDYKSYYGTEAMTNDTAGAGGFNWWES